MERADAKLYEKSGTGTNVVKVQMKMFSGEAGMLLTESSGSLPPVNQSSKEAFEVMRSLCAPSASLPLSDLSAAAQL